MNEKLISNIIPKENLRKVQYNVLRDVSDAVMHTAGPYGSNTMINRHNEFPVYSKDGKKVLSHIQYVGPVEMSIVDELAQLTSHVVKEVGDGTTSATRLAYHIFSQLQEKENDIWADMPTHKIIDTFKSVTAKLQEEIRAERRETTIEDIYKLCMISTNGNDTISKDISYIYEKYGLDVYIDLDTSNDSNNKIKEYNGITLEKGYASNAYINTENGHCIIRNNPRIYYFKDPINNNEMGTFLTNIIIKNIIEPGKNQQAPIPTVILCPNISRDFENFLSQIESVLYAQNADMAKSPLLIVTNLNKYVDEIDDIARLCNCPPIVKYIDPAIQDKDIAEGKAPTIETICDWYGTAEEVDADTDKTKFINPVGMYTDIQNKVPSDIYKGLQAFLEKQLENAEENNEGIVVIGRLKRRLRVLKANYVSYFVGGISASDREADRDLAEDAILNCRSAILHGIGYGANFEGLRAAQNFYNDESPIENDIAEMISIAYTNMAVELYSTAYPKDEAIMKLQESITRDMPINLRTDEWDSSVLTSINTDICILDGISKIITIMFTANQGLTSDPMLNKYMNVE